MFAGLFKFLRKGIVSRLVAGFLALYLFNISVDFLHSRTADEDLSVNEIESLVELVLEEVIGFVNLFEELPESDREPIVKNSVALVYLVPATFYFEQNQAQPPVDYPVQSDQLVDAAPFSIITPPPRQA